MKSDVIDHILPDDIADRYPGHIGDMLQVLQFGRIKRERAPCLDFSFLALYEICIILFMFTIS